MKSPPGTLEDGQVEPVNDAPITLDGDEPAAFDLVNGAGGGDLVLIADHASNRVPRCLHDLGLGQEALSSHIGWDAGTAVLSRRLAQLLDAPLVLSNYSRLVIDCNRAAGSAESILASSDGVDIPGNRDLGPAHLASRQQACFDPYHRAIERLLDERGGRVGAVLSIHSFSPVLAGTSRPWHIGVCYGHDPRLARLMLPALEKLASGPVGDNAPYTIEDGIDYSLPRHAAGRGLPHVMLEFRRDTIEAPQDARRMAQLVARAWASVAAALPAVAGGQ